MNKNSEILDTARREYIKGYKEDKTHIFPTLELIAKEFNLSLSVIQKKAANEGWYQKRKQHQNAREEYEIRKQFRGKYSKLAQISRNSLLFAEFFQSEIHKKIIASTNGEKNFSIEDQQRLITMTQKIQRLSKEATDTLNNLENPFTELLD